MSIWNPFKKKGCPSLRGDCPSLSNGGDYDKIRAYVDEIVAYWEKTSEKGCGNCMHFGYGAGDPQGLCQVGNGPRPTKPTDICMQWQNRYDRTR